MKKRLRCFAFFVLSFWVTTLGLSQDDRIKQEIAIIAERIDSATAATTRELLHAGLPSYVEAYKLAYQGIDAKALEELKDAGLDIRQRAFGGSDWTIYESTIFSDCIVIGRVKEIRYVPEVRLNKYVYVEVERWLKGKPNDRNMVVIRGVGTGSRPGGTWRYVTHEVIFKEGERVLLLLSKAGFDLSAAEDAPVEQERYKEDYALMYGDSFGNKLLIKGEWVIDTWKKQNNRIKLPDLVREIQSSTASMKKVSRKGGTRHD